MNKVTKKTIGELCTLEKGKIGIKKATPGSYPLVVTAEARASHNECHFTRPAVIIPLVSSTGHGHASLKRIHYQEGKFAVGNILCVVTPKDDQILNANFLYHYLDVYKEELLVSRMKGMANVTLPMKEVAQVKVPLMSIEEQNIWMELFETVSSNTGNLSTEITHQKTLLKNLRQAILQDVIQGKLTEEWRKEHPDVEPASLLLKKIKAEKERLIKEKKIKKQKQLLPIKQDEIPFNIPENWDWCKLEDVANSVHYGANKSAKPDKKDVRLLRITDIQNNEVYWDNVPGCDYSEQDLISYLLAENDILIARTGGTIGKSFLVKNISKKSLFASYLIRVIPNVNIAAEYLKMFIETPFYWKQLFEAAWGAGQPNVNGTKLKNLILPLPPLEEQIAIVAKVEKLFQYCDELEKQIEKSAKSAENLMQSVLKEAFE